jgi:hypothetical protein
MAEIEPVRINSLDPGKRGPKVWEKNGRDVAVDNFKTARDIGKVRLDYSRLNVFSSINEGDKEDNFKFQVQTNNRLRLGKNIDHETRIEVFNNRGRQIADSTGKGRNHDAYLRMISTEGEKINKGDYFIKISTIDSTIATKDHNYTIQLQMGSTVKHDYEVIEHEAKKPKPGDPVIPNDPTEGATKTALTLSGQGASTMMQAGAENLTNILVGAKGIFGALFNTSR